MHSHKTAKSISTTATNHRSIPATYIFLAFGQLILALALFVRSLPLRLAELELLKLLLLEEHTGLLELQVERDSVCRADTVVPHVQTHQRGVASKTKRQLLPAFTSQSCSPQVQRAQRLVLGEHVTQRRHPGKVFLFVCQRIALEVQVLETFVSAQSFGQVLGSQRAQTIALEFKTSK